MSKERLAIAMLPETMPFAEAQGANQATPRAAVALGSNLAPRQSWIEAAIEALRACLPDPNSLQRASLWASEPVNCPAGSGEFINTVVCFPWPWSAQRLLSLTQEIERSLGRERLQINAPRRIDLDLLLLGEQSLSTTELELPHPRLAKRRFVLEPLAELWPEKLLLTGQSVEQARGELAQREPSGIQKLTKAHP